MAHICGQRVIVPPFRKCCIHRHRRESDTKTTDHRIRCPIRPICFDGTYIWAGDNGNSQQYKSVRLMVTSIRQSQSQMCQLRSVSMVFIFGLEAMVSLPKSNDLTRQVNFQDMRFVMISHEGGHHKSG